MYKGDAMFSKSSYFIGIKAFITLLILSLYSTLSYAECTLKMAFKMGSKEPLMADSPDNTGIFKDLFTVAAERVGCRLKIERLPKQRVHAGLAAGTLDFYPGASFSISRSEYLHFMKNGLQTGEYGISSFSLPPIKNLKELAQYKNVIWLMESNSSKMEEAIKYGIPFQKVHYLNIDSVLRFINKRPQYKYFYITDKEVLDAFVNTHHRQLSDYKLQVHPDCCQKNQAMYLAFSITSKHFSIEKNPNYNPSQKISFDNQMFFPDKKSIAYKLREALNDMAREGVTENIYQKWYSTFK
jgi:hypothetical protein